MVWIFFVLAQDFGILNPTTDELKYNLVNPVIRNTVAVQAGGWAAIRFQANNLGMYKFVTLVHY
jgi:laccase